MDRDSYRSKPDAWQTGPSDPEQDRAEDGDASPDARAPADVFNAHAILSALSRDDADEATADDVPDGADDAAEPDLEAALRATFASFGQETYENDDGPPEEAHREADEASADDADGAMEPDLKAALRATFAPAAEETFEDDGPQDAAHDDDAFDASPAAERDAEDVEAEDPASDLPGEPLPAHAADAIASAPTLEDENDEAPEDDVPLFDDEAGAVEDQPEAPDPFAAEQLSTQAEMPGDDADPAASGLDVADAETDDVTAISEPTPDEPAAQLFADDRTDGTSEPDATETLPDASGADTSVAAVFPAPEESENTADGDGESGAVFAAPSAADAGPDDETVFASIDDPDMPGRKPRIALMGEFSAGKSTLSNLLIGSDPLPTRVTATQLPPVWISWGDGQAYREDLDGSTHAIDIERIGDIDPAETRVVRLFCRSDILELCDIIDMPGISDPNMSSDVWERLIDKADGVIWCTHATQAWRQSEAAVWESLDHAIFSNSLLLITRFDKLRNEIDRARVLKRVERETRGLFSARLPISLNQALSAGDDAETWQQSGAADFTDRLVSILNALATSLGSQTGDRLGAPLDDEATDANARPRSVRVHRGRSAAPVMPRRVVPRRVRPMAESGRRDAAF